MLRPVSLLVLLALASAVGGAFSASAQVVIRERVEVVPVAPSLPPPSGMHGTAQEWTFSKSGFFRLVLIPHPGSNGTYTEQCYAAPAQSLRFRFLGSRQGEVFTRDLGPYITENTIVNGYPPDCPDYYLTGFEGEIDLGHVEEGDVIEAEHFRQGESTGTIYAWFPEIPGDLSPFFLVDGVFEFPTGNIGGLNRLEARFTPDTLLVTVDPDSLAAGEEASFTVEAAGLPGDVMITLSVDDPSLGGLVVSGGPALARGTSGSASVQVPLAQVPSVRFVAADPAPDVVSVATITAASEDGRTGAAEVTLMPPLGVRWLTVANTLYPEDHLMVSRFPTDQRMPREDRFSNRQFSESLSLDLPTAVAAGPNAGDFYTVRPALNHATSFGSGVNCRDVYFRLRVLRGGQPVTFRSGDGQRTDEYYEYRGVRPPAGTDECRADRFVRFVSNAPPGSAGADGSPGLANPNGGTYDDEYEGRQTVRVELGDTVEIRAVTRIDGEDEESEPVSMPVGRESPLLIDPDAQADVFVRWATRPGTTAAHEIVTARASEDLAQAAVRLRPAGAFPYEEVQNAIGFSGPLGSNVSTWRPSAMGTVEVHLVIQGLDGGPDVTVSASYAYQPSDDLRAISSRLLSELAANTATGPQPVLIGVNAASGFYDSVQGVWALLIARGQEIRSITVTPGSEVVVTSYGINYQRLTGPMVRMTMMNMHDGDPSTLDVIEVGANVIHGDDAGLVPLSGAAFGYSDSASEPLPWSNTVLLDQHAADAADDLPHVAGHEILHVLLNETYPGAVGSHPTCRQPQQHDGDQTNLVWCDRSSPTEGYGTQKRLTQAQAADIRADHAPPLGSGPIPPGRLLRPFESAQRVAANPK